MISNDPCYKCEEREIGCHSECGRYGKWVEEIHRMNKLISKERNLDALATGHVVSTIRRNKKRKNR